MEANQTGPRITFKDVGEFTFHPAPVEGVEVGAVFRGTIEVLDGEPLRFSVTAPPLPPCTLRLMGFDGERWVDLQKDSGIIPLPDPEKMAKRLFGLE